MALLRYGIDFVQFSHTNSEDELSPGGVKVKLSLSFARASRKVSIMSAYDSVTSKVKEYSLGF